MGSVLLAQLRSAEIAILSMLILQFVPRQLLWWPSCKRPAASHGRRSDRRVLKKPSANMRTVLRKPSSNPRTLENQGAGRGHNLHKIHQRRRAQLLAHPGHYRACVQADCRQPVFVLDADAWSKQRQCGSCRFKTTVSSLCQHCAAAIPKEDCVAYGRLAWESVRRLARVDAILSGSGVKVEKKLPAYRQAVWSLNETRAKAQQQFAWFPSEGLLTQFSDATARIKWNECFPHRPLSEDSGPRSMWRRYF